MTLFRQLFLNRTTAGKPVRRLSQTAQVAGSLIARDGRREAFPAILSSGELPGGFRQLPVGAKVSLPGSD
jgi:hypothetical protein